MALVEQVLNGDPRALARALSLVENGSPAASALIGRLRTDAGRAYVIGLTGPPGAGKSTLVGALVTEFRRRGSRVGVLAVDPSSPFTGGAILGDRVRMQAHADDPSVFIRSMATRGQLGGLAAATADAATVLDAAGFEVILIETVGVGQAEVDIVRASDVTVLVIAPGAGDDVQALKAGIMEIADIFVINKADREGADRAAATIDAALSLRPAAAGEWTPPVLRTVATTSVGVVELVEALGRFQRERDAAISDRRRLRRERRPAEPAAIVLDHIGVAAANAERLAALLKDLFGLDTGAPEVLGSHRLRFVETGDATVELLEALDVKSPVAKFLGARPAGLHHICLRVPDIDRTLRDLKSRGVKLIDETARPGAHGSTIAFLHPSATEGILIEIKQCN